MNKKLLEEFRKKFCIVSKDSEDIWLKKSDGKPVIDLYLRWNIEQFISTLLIEEHQSIIEMGDKMKKEIIYGLDVITESEDAFKNLSNKGYNNAIKDYQTKIKSLK